MITLKEKLQQVLEEYKDSKSELPLLNKLTRIVGSSDPSKDYRFFCTDSLQRNILDNLPTSVIITDIEDRIVNANKSCEISSGYTLSEMKGKKPTELFTTESHEFVSDIIEKRKEGISSSFEVLQVRKDGSDWWSFITGHPFIDETGEIIGTIGFIDDISNLKAINELLNEANERYEDLFDSVNDGVIIRNAEGLILNSNNAAKRILGYDEKLEKVNIKEIILHNDESSEEENLADALRLDSFSSSHQGKIKSKNGDIKYIELKSAPIINNGVVVGAKDVVRDITSQKELEQKLIDNLKFLQTINYFIVDNLKWKDERKVLWDFVLASKDKLMLEDCVIYMYNPNDQLLHQKASIGRKKVMDKQGIINPSTLKLGEGIVGSVALNKKSEIIGDVSLDSRYLVDDEVRCSEIAVPILYEDQLLGVIDSENHKKDFFDGSHLQLFELLASFLAVKIMEARSWKKEKEREQTTSLALKVGKLGTWDWHIDQDKAYYDEGWADMLGFSKNELIQKDLNYGNLLHKDDKKRSREHIDAHVKGVSKEINHVIRLRSKDGSYRWIKDIGKVVEFTNEGLPSRAIGVHMDITESKNAEDYKNQLLTSLERVNNELKDYAYIVSHDLKAPLRGINSLLSWLVEDYSDKFDADGKKSIQLIQERVVKMDELIDGILTYSALGMETEEPILVDFNEIVNQIITSIEVPPHIDIIFGTLPKMKINKTRAIQLFQNLISNAVKYINKENGKISISAEEKNKEWLFKIKDNGIGIAPQYHEKVFQLFQKLDGNTKATGVGLSIVKKIIDLYQGRIWIESEPEVGTTFLFTLKNR